MVEPTQPSPAQQVAIERAATEERRQRVLFKFGDVTPPQEFFARGEQFILVGGRTFASEAAAREAEATAQTAAARTQELQELEQKRVTAEAATLAATEAADLRQKAEQLRRIEQQIVLATQREKEALITREAALKEEPEPPLRFPTPGEPPGIVIPAPTPLPTAELREVKPPTPFQKLQEQLGVELVSPDLTKRFRATFLGVPIALAVGFKETTFDFGKALVTQPVETFKGVAKAIIRPDIAIAELAAPAVPGVDPFGIFRVAGRITGLKVLGKVQARIIKAQPIKITKIDIPEIDVKGVSVGLVRKGRAQPLISVIDRKIKLGTPDISNKILGIRKGLDIKPGKALETKIIQKALIKIPEKLFVVPDRAKGLIPTAQILIRKTEKVPSRVGVRKPFTTERLTPKGVGVILKIAREQEGVIFGSLSREVQFPKTRGGKVKDIDIRLPKGVTPELLAAITKQAVERLRRVGEVAKKGDKPGIVLVKKKGKFIKAAEFKTSEGLLEGEVVPEDVLGFPKVGKPITVKGQKITPLAEELRGVIQGVVRVRRVGKLIDVFPSSKRFPKDILSVVDAVKTLKESRFIPSRQLGKAIPKFKGFFPEQFPKGKAVLPTGKQIIADFRSPIGLKAPSPIPISPISPLPRISPISPISEAPSISAISVSPPSPISPPSISPISPVSISPLPSISPPSISPLPSISPPLISPTISISAPSISPPSIISPPSPPSISPPSISPPSISPPSISPPSISPPSISPPTRIIPPISPPLLLRPAKKKPELQPGFNVFVKTKGKFQKINKRTVSRSDATELGIKVVDNTAAATFQIRKAKGFAKQKLRESFFAPDLSKFRHPSPRGKLPQLNTFVEKNKFRIDTTGEIFDIPVKGQIALARKRLFDIKPRKSRRNRLF